MNGDKKWHSFRGIAVWKRGHLKWDREAFRVNCRYHFRPSTYMRRNPHTNKSLQQVDDENQESSDSEWLPSDEED